MILDLNSNILTVISILGYFAISRSSAGSVVSSKTAKAYKDSRLHYQFSDDMIFEARSYLHCVTICSSLDLCVHGTYRISDRQCRLPKTDYAITNRQAQSGSIAFIFDSAWVLVFKISAGTGEAAYDLYMGNTVSSPADPRVLSNCGCNYKSQAVNDWPNQAITKVRLSVYAQGSEHKAVEFSAEPATRDGWFSTSNIHTSPWTDLHPGATTNYFSVRGEDINRRRFYMSHAWYGCHNDVGWFAVFDQNSGDCNAYYESGASPYMKFAGGSTAINTAYATNADEFAIFVQHSPPP